MCVLRGGGTTPESTGEKSPDVVRGNQPWELRCSRKAGERTEPGFIHSRAGGAVTSPPGSCGSGWARASVHVLGRVLPDS